MDFSVCLGLFVCAFRTVLLFHCYDVATEPHVWFLLVLLLVICWECFSPSVTDHYAMSVLD
jgi:hypothetical protein